ncbi:MAG: DegT/DnrJ/EryC1/StrS family aminotransferase, partial [Magnetococcales bacterium]|nr:DegT/DnrJ/EryC1/StrS family aminotransferase [Magnetococcales bacterium]
LLEVRQHGQSARYQHASLGINGRLDTIQAAALLVKADHFQDEIDARQKVAGRYQAAFEGKLPMQTIAPDTISVSVLSSLRIS